MAHRPRKLLLLTFVIAFQYSSCQDIFFNDERQGTASPRRTYYYHYPSQFKIPHSYQNKGYNNNNFFGGGGGGSSFPNRGPSGGYPNRGIYSGGGGGGGGGGPGFGFGIQVPFLGNINFNTNTPFESLTNGLQGVLNSLGGGGGGQGWSNHQQQGAAPTPPPPPRPFPQHHQPNLDELSASGSAPFPAAAQQQQASCRTIYRTPGSCVPLRECAALQNLIQNRPRQTVNKVIRGSACGTGSGISVCCPKSDTYSGEQVQPTTTTTTGAPWWSQTTTRRSTSSWWSQETTTTKPAFIPFTPAPAPAPPTPLPAVIAATQNPIDDMDIRTGCGYRNEARTRIVGGHEASVGSWPWIAALGYTDRATGKVNFLCGGALVSANHVVTAAHCVQNRRDLTTIRLGDHNLFSDADGATPIDSGIASSISNPFYNSKTFQNDIAILKLSKSMTPFTSQIHPICLPTTPELKSNLFENASPYVAGWGSTEFNGPSSPTLREVQIPVVPISSCKATYQRFSNIHVDDTNICAGLERGGKDSCQGDSGGPLMQPIGNNKYALLGVVSYGYKCAEPGFPGVYSRLTSHIDWVQDTIRKMT